jgi:hypothetical protein
LAAPQGFESPCLWAKRVSLSNIHGKIHGG